MGKTIVSILMELAMPCGLAATVCGGGSRPVKLDLAMGTRPAARTETLTYSAEWTESAGADATAVVSVDGATVSTETGSGAVDWTPTRNGLYELTHAVRTNGVAVGEVLSASFAVIGRFVEPGDSFEFTPDGRSASFAVEGDWVISNGVANAGDEVSVASEGLNGPNGKFDTDGCPMFVWQDYVAGTDPADENSRLTAFIEMSGDTPVVTWDPDLGAARAYKIWGSENLSDWQWPTNSLHRFFKVTVEME